MDKLFEKYGYYMEGLSTLTLKGQDGAKKIKEMMESIRKDTPAQIGGLTVTQFRDYMEDVLADYKTGETKTTGLPKSDVLYFELEGGAWCCIRPSGTEPKIKFYIGVKGTDEQDAGRRLEAMKRAFLELA